MFKLSILLILFILSIFKSFSQITYKEKSESYPWINSDTTIDYYFGKKVIDPYRNIENIESETVKAWIKAENAFYDSIIHQITFRDSLNQEIQEMIRRQDRHVDYPRAANARLFYPYGFMKDKDFIRFGYSDSLHEAPVEIYNTREINNIKKSKYNIDYYEPSYDGKFVAIGMSANGSEWADIYILDVEKKQLLPEVIERSKLGNIQWLPDNTGFFYCQDKEIITDEDKLTPKEDRSAKIHKLYTDPKDDRLIFSRHLNKDLNLDKIEAPLLFIFPSSNKVIVCLAKNTYCKSYVASLTNVLIKPANEIKWNKIISYEDEIPIVTIHKDDLYGLSYKNNTNGQLIAINLSDLSTKVIYSKEDEVLEDMVLTKKALYIASIHKGLSKLKCLNLKTMQVKNVNLPFSGGIRFYSLARFVSYYQSSENLVFTLTGYNKQTCLYLCNEACNLIETNIYPQMQYTNTPVDLVVEEVEVPSHDGEFVPLSIVYKKGIKLEGTNPTMIYAYGGFGVSLKPDFKRNRLAWYNHGGIYAVAHVRGGAEKGSSWYVGGLKATKPNTWKDLIACAEYLVNKKYTSPQNLAVTGSSAGGIAAGMAINERPDLFKAAAIFVGVLNPFRTENSTSNTYVKEFGTVKDSMEMQYLYAMDTYLNLKKGVKYPSVIFSASLNDSRVSYWQPAKTAALMQRYSNSDNIILLRTDDQGHFSYPSDADVYSFLFWQLGHPDFKLKTNEQMFKP